MNLCLLQGCDFLQPTLHGQPPQELLRCQVFPEQRALPAYAGEVPRPAFSRC
jgi:hypothetical protein